MWICLSWSDHNHLTINLRYTGSDTAATAYETGGHHTLDISSSNMTAAGTGMNSWMFCFTFPDYCTNGHDWPQDLYSAADLKWAHFKSAAE